MDNPKILITGAAGQLGRVLVEELRKIHGKDNVIATDINSDVEGLAPFEYLDILNTERLKSIIQDHKITQIYHLAAILSASGERNPAFTWNINLNGLIGVLDIVKELNLDRIFFPSTIAVFGKTTPREQTAQDVPLLPETVYGMSKTAGELWCNYYHKKYGLDIRSIRYPGVIGWQSLPEGGTTDYAVEIYHGALKEKRYECFLSENTRLPMIYMPDVINGTIQIMQAPKENISLNYGYNLASMSFTPQEITESIKKEIPDFEISYKPDFRQEIAASWTESIDDHRARKDWNWSPKYDLDKMTKDMILNLKRTLYPSS